MTSQQQYYQAKIFLNAYKDALTTLQEIAINKAALQKYKAYERLLTTSAQKGQVHITGNRLEEGTFFSQSRIRKLGLYSKKLFTQKLASFDTAKSSSELKKVFEAYL